MSTDEILERLKNGWILVKTETDIERIGTLYSLEKTDTHERVYINKVEFEYWIRLCDERKMKISYYNYDRK